MDNHPIPQDVTHFQFKLIGELTLKQFGYLAGAGILVWISISLPVSFFIKFLLVSLFGGTGVMFAFVPIEGRPTDMMLGYFFKALFQPNQYIFQQVGNPQAIIQLPPQLTLQAIEESKEQTVIEQPLLELPAPTQPPIQSGQPEPALQLQQPIAITEQLQETLVQKKQLEEQLAQLQQQLQDAQKPQEIPASEPITIPQTTIASPSVYKTIPASPVKTPQMPMVSEFPNIVLGVIKDARGNVLPNILVEIKDSEENPVRAFKTNTLGQFASATPLLNGTYTIVFEDPEKNHRFDTIQIDVTGEIMQPIEIISVDQREELRKELFGT